MISKTTIEQVRERTDIVALIGETVRLTRRGRSFVGLCPFHKEKSPSFHVSAERGFFHCFGCKESGSAIDFAMKVGGLSFQEAVRALAERAGVEIEENRSAEERKQDAAARKERDELYDAMSLAATFFEHALRGGPLMPSGAPHPLAPIAARALAARGLPLPSPGGEEDTGPVAQALQAFRVGYAPLAWDGLAKLFRAQGISPIVGERVGLLVPRSSGGGHYDRFRHRLMFAVLDVQGRVVAFSGRTLDLPTEAEIAALPEREREGARALSEKGEPPAKYVNSPESPIYTKGEHLFGLFQARHAIRRRDQAVLVEGNFDVVSLHARGLEHVVAPLGTALTAAQGRLLRRFTHQVVLMFDGDAAGAKATRASRAIVKEAGLSAKVARLPPGDDPDAVARRDGAAAIDRAIAGAKGLLEHLVDEALEEDAFASSSLEGRLERIRAVAKLLSEEDDPDLRALAKSYADRLSTKLIVRGQAPSDLRQLERLMERSLRGEREGGPWPEEAEAPAGPRARSRTDVDAVEREILGCLLDDPGLLEDPEIRGRLGGVLEGEIALAVAALSELGGVPPEVLLARMPPSIQAFAAARLAAPVFVPLGPEAEALSREAGEATARGLLLENARKLQRAALGREKALVVQEIERADGEAEIAALLREAERKARAKLGLA